MTSVTNVTSVTRVTNVTKSYENIICHFIMLGLQNARAKSMLVRDVGDEYCL